MDEMLVRFSFTKLAPWLTMAQKAVCSRFHSFCKTGSGGWACVAICRLCGHLALRSLPRCCLSCRKSAALTKQDSLSILLTRFQCGLGPHMITEQHHVGAAPKLNVQKSSESLVKLQLPNESQSPGGPYLVCSVQNDRTRQAGKWPSVSWHSDCVSTSTQSYSHYQPEVRNTKVPQL
jgi:hypothetical protein